MTGPEVDRLVTEILAELQRDNWQDRQMTGNEVAAADLAIRHTVNRLCKKPETA